MEHLVRMLPMMMASRSVQVPDSQSGMRIPAEGEESGAAGLNRSGQHPATEPLLPTQDASTPGNSGSSASLPPNALSLPGKTKIRPETDRNPPATSKSSQTPASTRCQHPCKPTALITLLP